MSGGRVRDRFLRMTLLLPGAMGDTAVEFIIDTGFDGELSVPATLAVQLGLEIAGRKTLSLADGTIVFSPYCQVLIDWQDAPRLSEVLLLDGSPLMGVEMLSELVLHAEMTEGGDVLLEAL